MPVDKGTGARRSRRRSRKQMFESFQKNDPKHGISLFDALVRQPISDALWSITNPLDRVRGKGRANVPVQRGEIIVGPGGALIPRPTSALRNAERNPRKKIMYHGTDDQFIRPRPNSASQWSALGTGHYVSSDKPYASGYGRILRHEEVQLGKPLIVSRGNRPISPQLHWIKQPSSGLHPRAQRKIAEQAARRYALQIQKRFGGKVSPYQLQELQRKNFRLLEKRNEESPWDYSPEFRFYQSLRNLPGVKSDKDVKKILKHAGYSSVVARNDSATPGSFQALLMSPFLTRLLDIERPGQRYTTFTPLTRALQNQDWLKRVGGARRITDIP